MDMNSFTFSAWVKLAALNDGQQVLIAAENTGGWRVAIDPNGSLSLSCIGGGVSSNAGIGDTDWHQVAVSCDGSTVSFYLDGSLVDSTSWTLTPSSNHGDYDLGGQNGQMTLNGLLDDVEIFSAGLSSQTIEDLYNGLMPQATRESLVAAYRFGGTSATVTDRSGNGNTGTIYGGVVRETGLQTVSITTSNLPVGSDTIEAGYSGDTDYEAEPSAASLTVTEAADVVPAPSIDSSQASDPVAGTPITLSAASPNYLDTYAWTVTRTLNGGTTSYTTGTGESFTFTPDMAGATYNVSLTAKDPVGTTSAAGTYTTPAVGGTSPTLTIAGAPSASVSEGTPLALSASMSNPSSSYTYAWTVTDPADNVQTTAGLGLGYTPEAAGTYTIALTATDAYGKIFYAGTSITVTAVAPAAIFQASDQGMSADGTTETDDGVAVERPRAVVGPDARLAILRGL